MAIISKSSSSRGLSSARIFIFNIVRSGLHALAARKFHASGVPPAMLTPGLSPGSIDRLGSAGTDSGTDWMKCKCGIECAGPIRTLTRAQFKPYRMGDLQPFFHHEGRLVDLTQPPLVIDVGPSAGIFCEDGVAFALVESSGSKVALGYGDDGSAKSTSRKINLRLLK